MNRFEKMRTQMQDLGFQARFYPYFIVAIIVFCLLCLSVCFVLYYQILHRPIPRFYAVNTEQKQFELTPYEEPNYLPDTIIRWASKAVVAAYTFDFANYKTQLEYARPYFTDEGWDAYSRTLNVEDVRRRQITVNGVVTGTPVISNQGPLDNVDYAWVVQVPFLATYQTGSATQNRNYIVVLTIVKMPTSIDPRGIGIREFVMRSPAA